MSSIFVRCLLLEMSLFIFMERVVRIQTFKKGMMFTQLMVLYSHPSSWSPGKRLPSFEKNYLHDSCDHCTYFMCWLVCFLCSKSFFGPVVDVFWLENWL